ncbi:MAG: hypothetical protein IPL79_06235 [Myxococcales bacterium]|nr:hypothetical protein [Myxococcales bacterium]
MLTLSILTAIVASVGPVNVARGDGAARVKPVSRTDAAVARRGYEWKRSGWTADAYLLKPQGTENKRWVYKRIKPIISSGNLMPTEDPRMRTFFRDMNIFVIDGLREASSFAAYKHLLPKHRRSGRFAMLQELGEGVHFDTLSSEAQIRASSEIEAVQHAARAALPGVEIDVNKGNILFSAAGDATSLYDPAGGWWARLIGDRVRSDPTLTVDKLMGPFLVDNSVAVRFTGGALKFGDGWLVANVARGKSYIVKHGFKMAYAAPHKLSAPQPLFTVLGPPIEDEYEIRPGVYEQGFERGTLTWDQTNGTQVVLEQ